MLLSNLSSGKEEQLLTIAADAGQDHRAADVETGIEEAGLRLGQAVVLVLPIGGIHAVITGAHVAFAVEVTASGLGFCGYNNGAVRLGGGVGRRLNFQLGDHVHIGCDRGAAGSVQIGDRGAVADDCDLVEAIAVNRVGACVLRKSGLIAIIGCRIPIACVARTRDQAQQFDGAAALDVHVVQLGVRNGVADLAGGRRRHLSGFGNNHDRGIGSGHGQRNALQLDLIVDVDNYAFAQQAIESRRGDFHVIGGDGNADHGEESLLVGQSGAGDSGRFIGHDDLRHGDDGSSLVQHGARQGGGVALREGCGAGKQQDQHQRHARCDGADCLFHVLAFFLAF